MCWYNENATCVHIHIYTLKDWAKKVRQARERVRAKREDKPFHLKMSITVPKTLNGQLMEGFGPPMMPCIAKALNTCNCSQKIIEANMPRLPSLRPFSCLNAMHTSLTWHLMQLVS